MDQNDGRAFLTLKAKPEIRLLAKLHRSMGMVDAGLVEVFRQLATGQAVWPLYLHGLVGVGKTRAALCLADFADSASYWAIDQLCDFVMSNPAGDGQVEWGYLAKKALVILDEIGQREKVGDLYASTLQKFLDTREHHADAIAIYISNVPPDQLGQLFDDRLVSRLLAGTVHHLEGDDRRRPR